MSNPIDIESIAGKADLLRRLHAGPGMVVFPNVWDAGSARAVQAAGFPAVATTSAGVAMALGCEDGEKAPLEEMIAAAARITKAVDVPVTVDFEAGYGLEPAEVVRKLLEMGAAGFNLEDSDHNAGGLVDASRQAERITEIKTAARDAGVDLVLNARVDVFIQRGGTFEEQVREGLRRARLYRDAGADCIYPILLSDPPAISQFVGAVNAININLRLEGQLSLRRAAELGVRRISFAGGIHRAATECVSQLATQIHGETLELGAG